jgi:hypothetical protein
MNMSSRGFGHEQSQRAQNRNPHDSQQSKRALLQSGAAEKPVKLASDCFWLFLFFTLSITRYYPTKPIFEPIPTLRQIQVSYLA